jgi:hypothetical protein
LDRDATLLDFHKQSAHGCLNQFSVPADKELTNKEVMIQLKSNNSTTTLINAFDINSNFVEILINKAT